MLMGVPGYNHAMTISGLLPDPHTCDRIRLARDARYDGRFFTAVLTTGIYCRPVCPAPPPRAHNVQYYATAAEAFSAGFRPCLRCRPESAPDSPAWLGTETTVRRALRLMQSGETQSGGLETLSERLGVSSRHLRRLFQQHLGVTPGEYLQHRNLLFAKKLLTETSLPILDVALASGFNSRRRFNAAFQDKLQLSPGAIRAAGHGDLSGKCTLILHYRPPYQWTALLDFYRARCLTGIETVDEHSYARTFRLPECKGSYRISRHPDRHALIADIRCDNLGSLQQVVAIIRQQFDLDANPDLIQAALETHPVLSGVVQQYPGLRLPGIISEFESVIRAIAGQQVSVQAARTLLRRLGERCGETLPANNDPQHPVQLFPSPQRITDTALDGLGFTGKRQEWMRHIAELYARGFTARSGDLASSVAMLQTLPGIGEWSAHYIAMRAFGEPDAFPTADLGLLNALKNPERPKARQLQTLAEQWRPWRAYATFYLWQSLH